MSDRFYDKRPGDGLAPAHARDVLRERGVPLAPPVRDAMEQRFGVDFSRIRIHTNERAAQSAHALDAQAYAVGRDLVFDRGRYEPDSTVGRGLLMHELAHAVQQGLAEASEGALLAPNSGPTERHANDMVRGASPPATPMPLQLARATRTFALTFDDGPHVAALGKGSNRTENVLDTLKAKKIKAAFFIQTAALDPEGHQMRGGAPIGKKLVKRMHDEGHAVGIHTGGTKDHEKHPQALKEGRLPGELEAAKSYVKEHTGEPAKWVRPPGGVGGEDEALQKAYQKAKLTQLLWDIDGDNGKDLKLDVLKQRMRSGLDTLKANKWKPSTPSPNFVVLYHDIQKGTSDNLATLIDYIKTTTQEVSDKKDVADFGLP